MTAAAACDRNIPAAECLFDHIRPYLAKANRTEPDSADFSVAYDCICPVHGDDHRSLRVSVGRNCIYLKCYAGCDELAVRDALIREAGVNAKCLPITNQRRADLVDQLTSVAEDPDMDHGHKLLLMAAHLRGMRELPRGSRLEELAAGVGLSRSRAFDYRRDGANTRTSGSYGSDEAPVKSRRSTRKAAPAEKSDGRTLSDGRTAESPMVGLSRKRTRRSAA
jgi:hypothetical protein